MLGPRTKQINTYGKRGKRVIDASASASAVGRPTVSTEIISIFDDMPSPPTWKGVVSRMKGRENNGQTKLAPSPKVVGLQKKKRLSPVLSPVKKKQVARVTHLKTEVATQEVMKSTPKRTQSSATGRPSDPITISVSPPRAPLSAVPLNILGSPATARKPRRVAGNIPQKSKKPFSPLVDVDIIVLDDDGQTISRERRVSRTNVEVNPIKRPSANNKLRRKRSEIIMVDSDSDEEDIPQPRRPKWHTTRNHLVLSDDSDDDYAPPSQTSKLIESQTLSSASSQISRTDSIVEVCVPSAPYKIHRTPPRTKPTSATSLQPRPTSSDLPHILPPSAEPVPTLYQHIPSPIIRPRQLTPIRGRKRLFEPPSPPSPTLTDLDLTVDFSELNLGNDALSQPAEVESPDYLKPLLEECHQDTSGPHNFSAFIESFPYDSILQSARNSDTLDVMFRKIGEASYSEVFGIGDVVLKVIPLRDESRAGHLEDDDGPPPTDAKDVRKEIIVTRAMGEVYGGFVKLLKTYVVRGRYPEVLLRLWDEYNERKGSESVRPDTFKVSQFYAIIVLPNGGPDLEAYTFHNASRSGWRQACSIFWQVAKALAHAELLVNFEHRDLHWGQILVKHLPTNALKSLNTNQRSKPKSHRVYMDDSSHGVQATVIDLGLSRMDAGDGGDGERVHWTPFDEEVFMGEGDYQFDVYRMMKELTRGAWNAFHPITNVLWLHYLLVKLLDFKGLKPPPVPRKPKNAEAPVPAPLDAAFTEKDCYDCLVDIENWLAKAIAVISPSNGKLLVAGKGRRKTQAPVKLAAASSGPARAGEIVAYGVKKGWIKPSSLV